VTLRVLLAGGGTAGHTSPLIATADALRDVSDDVLITALGTARGLEVRVVPAAGYRLELIPPVPLPRRLSFDLLAVPVRLGSAVKATLAVFDRVQPDVVVGFGAYVSIPAYVAARRRKVPLVIHEQNALPGIANKIGSRLAQRVATSFPDTPLSHGEYVGLPIRRTISGLDRGAVRASARRSFGLRADLPTLLVTGGSQGARRLNEAVSGAAGALAAAGIQVLHIAGPHGIVQVDLPNGAPPYVVLPFVDRMDLAYAAADLSMSRSGASTVTETAAVGLPAIFVPLPIGNGEQAFNARAVVNAGGAYLVDDSALTPDYVSTMVPDLLHDTDTLTQMSAAAAGLIHQDADRRFAAVILEAAGGIT
jgi:UDP-N-acetylglucosamine--N-acetylmuramyl-(pentapeptide) pyrophosphoryl-undecaprenol N-acetylglucosamine transferase